MVRITINYGGHRRPKAPPSIKPAQVDALVVAAMRALIETLPPKSPPNPGEDDHG